MDTIVGKKMKGLQVAIIKPAISNNKPRKIILCA